MYVDLRSVNGAQSATIDLIFFTNKKFLDFFIDLGSVNVFFSCLQGAQRKSIQIVLFV